MRLAGPEARAIATPMLRLKHDLEAGRAVFGELVEPCGSDILVRPAMVGTESGEGLSVSLRTGAPDEWDSNTSRAEGSAPPQQRIDEVVVTYFAKPHSYTTDDVIEISAH